MDSKSLGRQILQCRLEKKLSQSQLAEMAGVTQQTVRHYEYGTKVPSLETLICVANALDVGLDKLLCRQLKAAKPIRLHGIAKKLEPLSPDQLVIFEDVLNTLLRHKDHIAPSENDL